MEVRKGYKQTDLGAIPVAWEVKRLGLIAKPHRGASPRPIDSPIWFDENSSIGWVRISDVTKSGMYLYETTQCLSPLGVHHSRLVSRGSLIMSICATVGRPIITEIDTCIHDGFVVFEHLQADIYFLYYILKSIECDWSRHGQTGSQMNLNTGLINQTQVAIPNKVEEQTAIATALSDTDGLISSLENLIAKKRSIKQGAMQELLTGKKRLSGFTEKWEEKSLGNICLRITTGKLDANAMDANGSYRFYTCAKSHYYINDYAFDDEALLISGNGENVGYVHYYKGKFNAYQRTYVLTGFNADIAFVKFYLEQYLEKRITVEVKAGNTPYITMGTLTDMSIYLPSAIPEQAAVAQLLSDMDTEIESLENKLSKYRLIKQGMMQELLTGKTRLV